MLAKYVVMDLHLKEQSKSSNKSMKRMKVIWKERGIEQSIE